MTQLAQEQAAEQKNKAPLKIPESIPQIVDKIRKGDPDYNYKKLSDELKGNKEVIAAAVYMDSRIINNIPKTVDLDAEYILRLVKINGDVLPRALESGVFPKYYSSDKLLWKEAAITTASVIAQIPTKLFKNKDEYHSFIKEIIVKNTEAYNYLKQELKEDREIALTLINTNQGAHYFMQVPKTLLNDGKFLEEAIKLNGEVFSVLFKEIQKGTIKFRLKPEHVESAVASDSSIIKIVPLYILENEALQITLIKTSINAKKELEARNIELSPKVKQAYIAMLAAYDNLGIDLIMHDRENKPIDVKYFDNSKEIIRNRYSVASDEKKEKLESILGKEYFQNINTTKPTCLVLYPKYDGEVFNQDPLHQRDSVDRLCNSHRVIFYQVSNTNEIVDNFRESTSNGKNKISLLVLGGHGDPYSILLSKGNDLNISQSDLYPRLNEFMRKDGSNIILNSCSTGAKTPAYGQLNIASFLAGIWPESAVIAPTKDTYQAQISSTLDGSAVSAFYENKKGVIPRLELPRKVAVDLNFNQENDVTKAALARIFTNLSKTGGSSHFTSRHGITLEYLGIIGKEVQTFNLTPWEKEALGDLLALKMMKDFVDAGVMLSLKEKGREARKNVTKELILKALNLKEKDYLTESVIEPQNKTIEITISKRIGIDLTPIYNCKFNYDTLELIYSSIDKPDLLSEINK